jgi:hypothetical protein
MNFLQTIPESASSDYCWLLVIDSRPLGVHLHDGWCMQIKGQTVFFDEEYKCVHLLPVLEKDPATFSAQLRLAERSHPSFASSIKNFPKKMLLKHVFHTSVSGYWPERALSWLTYDTTVQPALKQELEGFSRDKIMPQSLRHQARKIVQRLSLVEHQPATT